MKPDYGKWPDSLYEQLQLAQKYVEGTMSTDTYGEPLSFVWSYVPDIRFPVQNDGGGVADEKPLPTMTVGINTGEHLYVYPNNQWQWIEDRYAESKKKLEEMKPKPSRGRVYRFFNRWKLRAKYCLAMPWRGLKRLWRDDSNGKARYGLKDERLWA